MFCKNCGTQLPDDAVFCGNCGTKVEVQAAPQEPVYTAPQEPAYVAPEQPSPKAHDPHQDELASSIMGTGIASIPLAFVFGLPGIIVAATAKKKVAEYTRLYGEPSGRAKVGAILSKVGFPLGWGMLAFYLLYIILLLSLGTA